MSHFEKYLAYLDDIFVVEPLFFSNESLIEGIGNVTAIVYQDIPEPGMITGFSYGLSLYAHPDWKYGRPELCISVDSSDVAWGEVVGFLANQGRGNGNIAFCYGDTINFREQIADDSSMDAFLLFAPAILAREQYSEIDVGAEYKINIAGLYPIYSSEIDTYHRIGLYEFWHHPKFELYSVTRPPIF